MVQVPKKSEVSSKGLREMDKELKKNFSELHQVLNDYENEWMEWLKKDGSEVSTKEKSS